MTFELLEQRLFKFGKRKIKSLFFSLLYIYRSIILSVLLSNLFLLNYNDQFLLSREYHTIFYHFNFLLMFTLYKKYILTWGNFKYQ